MRHSVIDRRCFLRCAVGALTAGAVTAKAPAAALQSAPSASALPRWRGFNLLEKFVGERSQPFRAWDFEQIAGWGFDFVRLPLSYRAWVEDGDWLKLREDRLREIDEAVALGKRHGVHVNLNLHRAPGYCVNPPAEPLDLWTNEQALEACVFHWAHFARRYRGLPNTEVSFDLLNEPANVDEATYARVVRRLVAAIREQDPGRLIIADGLRWGRDPVHSLVDLRVAQSTRGYDPMGVSHYQASWVGGADKWPVPTWPLGKDTKDVWDRERLRRERIAPWEALAKKGVGVHVGEWGAYRHTPHPVVLAWMRDVLELWKEAGWGWALWNFRGDFGVLDSRRADVQYEDWKGHKLDRAMLELLRAY